MISAHVLACKRLRRFRNSVNREFQLGIGNHVYRGMFVLMADVDPQQITGSFQNLETEIHEALKL